MCISVFQSFEATDINSKYKFILAFNRDEVLDRPTLKAQIWKPLESSDSPTIVSGLDGKDLSLNGEVKEDKAGIMYFKEAGTWLGFNNFGKFGLLTNLTQLNPSNKTFRTRGELITTFLKLNTDDIEGFLKNINTDEYDGFNLILGDLKTNNCYWLCNDKSQQQQPLDKEKYVIVELDKPTVVTNVPFNKNNLNECKKVTELKDKFNGLVARDPDINFQELLNVMGPDAYTDPTKIHSKQDLLNYIFIPQIGHQILKDRLYGTRTTTLVSLDIQDNLSFREFGWKNGFFQLNTKLDLKLKL